MFGNESFVIVNRGGVATIFAGAIVIGGFNYCLPW